MTRSPSLSIEPRLRSLGLAIEAASRARDLAARQFSAGQDALRHAQQQQAQIGSYEQETQQRWLERARHATQRSLMEHHHQFVGKLQSAMHLQSGVIAEREQTVAQARQTLMTLEQRLMGLQRYRERVLAESERSRARTEQKQSDEWASIRWKDSPGQRMAGLAT